MVGKGAETLPHHNSSPLGSPSLRGKGRVGAGVGEALEGSPPFSLSAACSSSLSLGASARGRAEGLREERGTDAEPPGRAPRSEGGRAGGTRAVHGPHPARAGRRGQASPTSVFVGPRLKAIRCELLHHLPCPRRFYDDYKILLLMVHCFWRSC